MVFQRIPLSKEDLFYHGHARNAMMLGKILEELSETQNSTIPRVSY